MYNMVELGTLIKSARNVRCGENLYPILSMTMHNGLVFQGDKFKKVVASKDTSDYKVVYRNQLVISFPIDEGVLAAQRIVDAGIVSPAYSIWDIDMTKILPEFLEYALRCERALDYYKAKLRGSTARRRSLPIPTLLSFTVPLPSIEEQQNILEVIQKVKAISADRTASMRMLENLIKSRFVELFGDPQTNPNGYALVNLSDVATYFNGLTYKPENVAEIGTIVLRSSNIQNSQLDFADTVRVDCTVKEKLMVQENDILMCSRNGSARLVGKVALIKGIHEPMTFGAFMMIIRSRYHSYLMTYFQMDAFRQQIKTGATTTINQITGRILDEVTIPLPPMELVEQFAAFVERVDKLKSEVQKSLDETQLLMDSLMQKYFG